jgi:hypothetical protein
MKCSLANLFENFLATNLVKCIILTSFKNFKNQGVTRVERRCDFFYPAWKFALTGSRTQTWEVTQLPYHYSKASFARFEITIDMF